MFNTLTRMGASAAGAYEIERSVRFNGAQGDVKLTRTAGTSTSQNKFTFSTWVKLCRGSAETNYGELINGYTASNDAGFGAIYFYSGSLRFAGWATNYRVTNRMFRDPSSWYHIIVAVDTTLGTAGNRVKIYVNGVEETSFSASNNPGQNDTFGISNNSAAMQIGMDNSASSSRVFDGYMAETHFIDGQQLTPDSFGETNSDTGQWVPKKYAGTHGNNGFYLSFKDNSSTGNMFVDDSANSNNWSHHNMTNAAGAGCDSLEDTPTNNFCTFNPLWGRPSYFPELTNGNLDCHLPNGSYYQFAVGTIAVKSGKWYWEVTIEDSGTAGDDTKCTVGVASAWHPYTSGEPVKDWRGYHRDGQKIVGVSGSNTTSAYGASYTDGDVIGVALDLTAGTLVMYKNGTTQGTLDSAMLSSMDIYGWIPLVRGYASPNFNFNFGQRAFAHTPPTGHKKLCTANLPEPTIKKPTDYFNTVLYTGNGAVKTVTGVGFQPNLLINKRRDAANVNLVVDSVRGVSNGMSTALTSEDYTSRVASFNSDGFVSDNGSWGQINTDGATYVAWNWKESATAGFDIVSYTGTGSNPQTRSHSLGVAPEMIILKNRSGTNGDEHWAIYHHKSNATPEDYWARMNTTGAFEDLEMWNDTAPTSSVFTTQNHAISNYNGDTFIAYLFSGVEGYSKAGGYSGNGNADGAFVYLGFKPAFLLIKCTNSAESWEIYDNKRLGYNVNNESVFPDLDNAESSEDRVDLLSNGFKARINSGGLNGSSKDYIYLAFAESPFKYANAR